MHHTCFLFALSKYGDHISNWCDLEFDLKDGTISGSVLRTLISKHHSFSARHVHHDHLILYDVSAKEHEDFVRSLPSKVPFDLAQIAAVPQILPFETISVQSPRLIIAVHSPPNLPPAAQALPTLQSVSPAQLPATVRLPISTEGSPSQLSTREVLHAMLIHTETYDTLSMDDCVTNRIQTREDLAPTPPDWVESFIVEISRRRELEVESFQALLATARRITNVNLTQTILDRFVCNNNDLLRTSTGQTQASRTFEGNHYLALLSSAATEWSEMQLLELFKTMFGDTEKHAETAGFNLTLRNQKIGELGIPVLSKTMVKTYWYLFHSDAALLRGPEPYLLVKFDSKSNDYARMLLYGGSLVRWISRVCLPYCFILPLLFVSRSGEAELLYMYELEEEIRFVRRRYSLNSRDSRLDLFITISNIIDREPLQEFYNTLRDHLAHFRVLVPTAGFSTTTTTKTNEDDGEGVDLDDRATIRESSRNRHVDNDPDMDVGDVSEEEDNQSRRKRIKTGKRKSQSGNRGGPKGGGGGPKGGGGGASGASGKRGGGPRDGGAAAGGSGTRSASKQGSDGVITRSRGRMNNAQDILVAQNILDCEGYTVITTEREMLSVKKGSRKFIVKLVRKKREQRFYDLEVEHHNIIKTEDVIYTSDRYLAILPELVSLDRALDPKSSAVHKLSEMSHDLANGLQFLHDSGIAHMDIKPSNLVYHPKSYVLKIIDFDTVVWINSLDDTISGQRGTLAWMAPEILHGIPFKPILADRYACGVVFRQMAEILKLADTDARERWVELQSFSSQLMNVVPSLRPSLSTYNRKPLQLVVNR